MAERTRPTAMAERTRSTAMAEGRDLPHRRAGPFGPAVDQRHRRRHDSPTVGRVLSDPPRTSGCIRRTFRCVVDAGMSRPPRIPGFSYVGPYRYFLTFCALNRQQIFVTAPMVESVLAQFRKTAFAEAFAISAVLLHAGSCSPARRGHSGQFRPETICEIVQATIGSRARTDWQGPTMARGLRRARAPRGRR